MKDKLNVAKETIADMQVRQLDVAALYAIYINEPADAKATIDTLQLGINSGKCGLRLNATWQNITATSSDIDDAAAPDLLTTLNGIISPFESV